MTRLMPVRCGKSRPVVDTGGSGRLLESKVMQTVNPWHLSTEDAATTLTESA
jgi:hypothetical protein